ncbi:MAG: B12-binding domain-containing radical SAM protein [Deltaproteobacteria bacterium]|nr:B12-binding domain-containing radical SAM protein [Deltaproteobacteria bacterium]
MKILLIYPYSIDKRIQEDDISVVPMGLYYIGALLKENHYDVEILNFYDLDKDSPIIRSILVEKKPDLIGFSILHANRWGGIEIARIARDILPAVRIVFGGIGATFLWEHLLIHFKEIDFVITGEGEYSFLNLLESLQGKVALNVEDIGGLAFRDGERVKKNEARNHIRDLNELPNPARYFTYQHLSLARGCPGRCSFCGSPQFWGRGVRFHSSDYFVDQLDILYKKGVTFFYFSDDTFTLKKNLVIEICQKVIERNLHISWAAISRVNYIDEEILLWMRKAGCAQISYGVESGSEKIRNKLNKKIKTEDIKKAFDLTVKYGILARAYFIYGCPGENEITIQETIDLIKQIKPLSVIFYILVLFPGTALYEDFKQQFKVDDDIWLNRVEDIPYFETDPDLSGEAVVDFGKKLRLSYYDNLNNFADNISLADKKELYACHADFYSRLGMTFSHGDYAGVDAIKYKDKTAAGLYQKALDYYPDHRACLGLGIIQQKHGMYEESASTLAQGVSHYPESEPLNICLGITWMNLGKYDKALSYFLKFQDSKAAVGHIANCYKALGDTQQEMFFLEKLRFI